MQKSMDDKVLCLVYKMILFIGDTAKRFKEIENGSVLKLLIHTC